MVEQKLSILVHEAANVFKAAGATNVYLFGSAAKGTMRDDSDIDFAVSGLRPERFFKTMSQAEDVLQRRLDVVDLDESTPFTRYLKQKGGLHRVF
ncbi:MAG TPA: nucleotidyltransferase domain-containing protein [Chloroflexi bacterium]|nr:MAG: hypothetical protein B6243_01270 [Anaerolineaceae bacterium 4572_5.2]HEY86299.1 nucleotidyltransferase domain-containing protein [Chloroflexota bacterium]